MRKDTLGNRWHEAGLIDPESANLGRPIDITPWFAPIGIELKGDRLIWQWEKIGPRDQKINSEPKILEQFVNLYNAPGERIKDYAKRWGVLRLCEHLLPLSHNRYHPPFLFRPSTAEWMQRRASEKYLSCEPLGDTWDAGWEPLETWRQFALLFRTLLNLAASIHLIQPGKPEHWQIVEHWFQSHSEHFARQDHMRFWESKWQADFKSYIDERQNTLSRKKSQEAAKYRWSRKLELEVKMDFAYIFFTHCVRTLLLISGVKINFLWVRTGPKTHLEANGLFDALVAQLILAINRSQGFVMCSSCGELYTPKRRPRPNQRHYCGKEECKKRAAWKNASARYYQKKARISDSNLDSRQHKKQ
jgi:hypothetical protein